MKAKTKTKLLVLPCVSLCALGMMWCTTQAFSVTIEPEDIKHSLEYVQESELTSSAKGILSQARDEIHDFIVNWLADLSGRDPQHLALDTNEEQIALLPNKPLALHYASSAWGDDGKKNWNQTDVKKYFSDVAQDSNKEAIYLLAKYQLVNPHAKKFYPKNYIRLHECVKMLLRGCEVQLDRKFDVQGGQVSSALLQTPKHYQVADSLGMLKNIEQVEEFERIVTAKDLAVLLKNFSSLYAPLGKQAVGVWDQTWEKSTRSEMAGNIVSFFDFPMVETPRQESHQKFVDTVDYDTNVKILLSHTMYPFSEIQTWTVSRAGFAKFLAQVHASLYGKSLVARGGREKYVDVAYIQQPYMYYLQKNDLIDYLTEVKRGKKYFYPERAMTQHEVMTILSDAFEKKFAEGKDADKKNINYSELSALFVEAIATKQASDWSWNSVSWNIWTTTKNINILDEVIALFSE